ncbi:DUF1499 domain-containing protein [Ruegeria sp. HKCCD7559]|uniref:DUF1499 domain-containing protein n=1 Tax=Ruegeria sp. HKCCD7559 TaxID=2683005 RepID=UPI001491E923|nr:DUF1499 domain-containing protein [Ruegeria sp. HKCCD7559]NOC44441.1 DUF1499 domain-containing protein [Ruegeria sp. HKCCD7559]
MKKMVLWAVIALVLGLVAYVRLAPSALAQWHIAPVAEVDQDLPGGVLRVVATGPGGLENLDRIARATPRTSVLAGSVDEGMITYVTRTIWIGFPDYTTVQQDGDTLRIHGRLRFGRRDFGVNKARVDGWLEQM